MPVPPTHVRKRNHPLRNAPSCWDWHIAPGPGATDCDPLPTISDHSFQIAPGIRRRRTKTESPAGLDRASPPAAIPLIRLISILDIHLGAVRAFDLHLVFVFIA